MKINKYLIILLFSIIFLFGCQQEQEVTEQQDIEIISEENVEEPVDIIDEELEKEFDDGLDEALAELEEIRGYLIIFSLTLSAKCPNRLEIA